MIEVEQNPDQLKDQLFDGGRFVLRVAHNLLDLEVSPGTKAAEVEKIAELIKQVGVAAHALMEASSLAEELGLPAYHIIAEEEPSRGSTVASTVRPPARPAATRPGPSKPKKTAERTPAKPERIIGLSPLAEVVLRYADAYEDFGFEDFKASDELRSALPEDEVEGFKPPILKKLREEIVDYAAQRSIGAGWYPTGKTRATRWHLEKSGAVIATLESEKNSEQAEVAEFIGQLVSGVKYFVEVDGSVRRSLKEVMSFVANELNLDEDEARKTVNNLADAKILFKESKDGVVSVTFRELVKGPAIRGESSGDHSKEIKFTEQEIAVASQVLDALAPTHLNRGEAISKIYADLPEELKVGYGLAQLNYTARKLRELGLVKTGRPANSRRARSGNYIMFANKEAKTKWTINPEEILVDLRSRLESA